MSDFDRAGRRRWRPPARRQNARQAVTPGAALSRTDARIASLRSLVSGRSTSPCNLGVVSLRLVSDFRFKRCLVRGPNADRSSARRSNEPGMQPGWGGRMRYRLPLTRQLPLLSRGSQQQQAIGRRGERPLRARLHTVKKGWQRAADKVVACRPSRSLDRDPRRQLANRTSSFHSIGTFCRRGNTDVRVVCWHAAPRDGKHRLQTVDCQTVASREGQPQVRRFAAFVAPRTPPQVLVRYPQEVVRAATPITFAFTQTRDTSTGRVSCAPLPHEAVIRRSLTDVTRRLLFPSTPSTARSATRR